MKKPYLRELAYFVLVAVGVFALCCALSGGLSFMRQSPPSAHAWLHSKMALSAEQERNLVAIETQFAAQQKELQGKVRAANKELASAMLEDKTYSPRVTAAVERIHSAQGELQKVTLQHIFEMQGVLSQEQAEQLNRFAANALIQNP